MRNTVHMVITARRALRMRTFCVGRSLRGIMAKPVIFCLAVFVVLGAWFQAEAQAQPPVGTASGMLTINGKAISLKYSYAMLQPNTFEADKNDIAVLLTETPLAEGALSGMADLKDATRNHHGWAYFKINSVGKPIYEAIDHPATKEGQYSQIQMSGFTHAGFQPKKMDKNRIEGSFATSQPADFMTYKYEINVEFAAPLLTAKLPEPLPDSKTGKALPAGGGEPGKAYRTYHKAALEKDLATFRKIAPQAKDMSDGDLRDMMDFMAAIAPVTPKIARGFVKKERAVLYVEGAVEGAKRYGTVELRAHGKRWYVVDESWSDKPPKK